MTRPGTPRRQTSLFDELGVAADSAALVTVTASTASLTRAQRSFNRLTDKIRRQRAELAEWDTFMPRFEQRARAELDPVEREVREHQRRLVRRLDALLTTPERGERLSKRHCARVRSQIIGLIDAVLGGGPDAELEALYDRHSDISREQLRREEMGMMESALSGIFGAEAVRGHGAADIDELLQHAGESLAGQAAEKERKRMERAAKRAARGGRPTKAELAAERRAQAEREASQSVREIFRKLASALHPDREADSTQRERKTALMQRVNLAYKRKDLLELLTLQIEIEQIDADQLANAPEQRLEHFNAVLREQSKTLADELEQRVTPFRTFLGTLAGGVTPKSVDKALTERVFEGRTVCKEIARDLEALDDRARRRAVLDAMPDPDEDLDDFLELAMLLDSDLASAAGRPPRVRRQKKPARHRKKAKKSRR
jgi:hypothetical protein